MLMTLIRFEEAEENLSDTLNDMKEYNTSNYHKLNSARTQVIAFHLRNGDAKRKVRINWEGSDLENCDESK